MVVGPILQSTQKAYAADTNTALAAAKAEYRAMIGYDALVACINADGSLQDTISKATNDYTTGAGFNLTGNDYVASVGNVFEPIDGNLKCSDTADLTAMAKSVGYDTLKDFNKMVWPQDGACTGKDNCLHISKSDILTNIKNNIAARGYAGPDNDVLSLSPSGRYYFWTSLFGNGAYGCGGSALSDGSTSGSKSAVAPNDQTFYFVVNGAAKKYQNVKWSADVAKDEVIKSIGIDYDQIRTKDVVNGSGAPMMADETCTQIAGHLTKDKADALVALAGKLDTCAGKTTGECAGISANAQDSGGAGGGVDGTGGGDQNVTCEQNGNPLNWILCPVFNGVADFSDFLFRNMVEPLLRVSPVNTDPESGSFKVWSSFRLYGNIILVIGMLVIVFSQAIGGGLIDAYTAKKVMPRIIAAAIMINLSIYIVAILVDLMNILGGGLGQLMIAPFKDAAQFTFSPTAAQGGAIIGIGAGSIGTFLTLGIFSSVTLGSAAGFLALFVLLPAVLGLLGAFITLVIRQGLILILILVSPIAFALYCLPNTEKYFQKWWELLFKTLLVYPIVIAIFAAADILTVTIQSANGFTADKPLLTQVPTTVLASVIAFTAQFLPLVLIPYAFKLAGGAVGNLHAQLTNFGKRGAEAIKGNANDPNSLRNKTRRNVLEKFAEGQGGIAQSGRKMADDLAAGKVANTRKNRRVARRGAFVDVFGNVDQRLATYNKQAQERRAALSDTGLDDLVFAGAGYEAKDGDEYFEYDDASKSVQRKVNNSGGSMFVNSKGKVIGASTYRKGKSLYGGSISTIGQGIGYTLGKAQNDGNRAALRYSLARNAQALGWDQTQLNSAWAAATYPLKGTQSTEWYSKPQLQPDGGVKFDDVSNNDGSFGGWLGDVHQTRQGFQLGQLTDGDWRMLQKRQQDLEAKALNGSATQLEATQLGRVYEVFDAASQKLMAQTGEPGTAESSAAGATAAAKPHIEAAIKQRQLGFSAQDANGNRSLYKPPAGGTGPVTPAYTVMTTGTLGRDTVQDASNVGPRP